MYRNRNLKISKALLKS